MTVLFHPGIFPSFFFRPDNILDELFPELEQLYSSTETDPENISQQLRRQYDAAIGKIVNVIVSYDMGWTKRGNGKSYDSLNGYGAIIGFLSKKILDFGTRNKLCKKCDVYGHSPDDHDRRKNFKGSAKAMEADLGAELVNKSEILKKVDINVRVVVGDDDSSMISAILNGSMHRIFKMSCRIHLTRNYVKGLYKLKIDGKHSELARKEVIPHLRKCFAHALAQHEGDPRQFKTSLLSIRDHLYGQHENCGEWCRKDAEEHTIQLKSQKLHSCLYDHLAKYANNANKFAFAATTQLNENFNGVVSHRMPKNRCYSTSASADYRVAGAVLSANEGNKHLMSMETELKIPFGSHTQ